jgi:hypothetical protein
MNIEVQPVSRRTGEGLDYKDVLLPMSESEAKDVLRHMLDLLKALPKPVATGFDLEPLDDGNVLN